MRVNNIVVLIFGVVFNTVADQSNSDSEASGLALEIEEDQINKEDYKVDVKLIDAQKFIGEPKTIIDKANNVLVNNNNSRRDFNYTKLERFTDFIRHIIKILQKYDDNDLELFFAIIDGEVRKYNYRGCKFHELIDNDGLRKFMGKKLETITSMRAADIRKVLAAVATKLEKEDYDKNEKEFIDFINSIYRQDAVEKFNKILLNIDVYRLKNRRNIDLSGILREGIRSIIFDYYTDLSHNARTALKSKLDEFWNYIMSVSASIVMQHYLGNLRIFNSAKTYDADSLSDLSSKQKSTKTTKEERRTFKQMYVEKNLDLKYDPYAYDHLTTKYRSELEKDFSLHNNDQNTFKVPSTKTTNDPNIPRQRNKERMDSKTDLVKNKRPGKSKSSDKHKHYTKTTDDLRTLRQMYVKGMDSKNNSQVINDVTKTSRVRQPKPFDNDNYSGKREGVRKTTKEAKIHRQIYLENFDFKYHKPQVNTDSKEYKSKDNRLKHVRKNKGKNTNNAYHSIKTTDDPTTSKEKHVQIMNLKYGPSANRNSKELKDKCNVKAYASLDTDKKKRKYILREHKLKDNTGFFKAHKQNNIFIDVDTIYVTRDDKHKVTKDHRVPKQKYLEEKNEYLSTVIRAEYDKLVLDKVTKILFTQTTHPKKQMMMRKRVDDVRVGKRLTTRKPIALEILKDHSAMINVNAATTRIARRNYDDRNIRKETNLRKIISPMLAKATSVTNRRRYYTPDDIPSEEGLSIEAFKNSYRRMESNISNDSILNDKNVITKIKQLENELKVFKTKLQNDTEIIENLNSKLYETENKLKEFCNQQFKIVTENNNTPGEFHFRADSNENDNGKSQIDKYNEFMKDTAKKLKAKLKVLIQNKANKNKQVLTSEPNKDSYIINRQTTGDMDHSTFLERSRSENTTKRDIIEKPAKTKYETDTHKLTNDQDKVVSFSKLIKDEITNKNFKYTVQERGEDRNIETKHNISKNYKLGTIKNNLNQKNQLDSNKFKNNIKKQADISLQEHNSEVKSNEREIISNIVYDLDSSKENNVQAIGRNTYPGEIESYNKTQSTRIIDPRFYKSDINMKYNTNVVSQTTKYFDRSHIDKVIGKEQFNTKNEYLKKENAKRIINRLSKSENYANSGNHEYNTKPTEIIAVQQTLPTPIMSSLVNLKSDNNLNINPNEINFDVTQAKTEIHKKIDVIKAPRKDHEYDAYTEPKMSVINDMFGEKFNQDGVIIDGEKFNNIEVGEVVQDKAATEADLIVEHWLNATKVEKTNSTTDALFGDNTFKEVDVVLGRLAKDKIKYAR